MSRIKNKFNVFRQQSQGVDLWKVSTPGWKHVKKNAQTGKGDVALRKGRNFDGWGRGTSVPESWRDRIKGKEDE